MDRPVGATIDLKTSTIVHSGGVKKKIGIQSLRLQPPIRRASMIKR